MRKIILSVILLIVTGCSAVESLKSSNTLNLLIDTPHVEGAECALSDKTGKKWRLWETPGTIAIQEGHPPLVIICTKKGFKKSVLTINEHKEELLTIDGERIDISIYNQFPTKFPRLIPAAIKEVAGFAQDPTGSLSTTYPNKVVVWMEPKEWESEEQMRAWAFDREIQDRSDFISEEEAKLTEEQRQAKRRAEKKAREQARAEYFEKLKQNLRNAGKKGVKNTLKVLNPEPAIKSITDKGRLLDLDDARQRTGKAIDLETENINERKRRLFRAKGKQLKDDAGNVIDAVNPGSAVDFLNHRNDVRRKVQKSREENKGTVSPDDDITDSDAFILPDELPAGRDATSPQDLFDVDNKANGAGIYKNNNGYKYDEKGRRIVPVE